MNLVEMFQGMKRVFGICPCCGKIFRLSDATLYTKGPPPRTEFDRLDDEEERLHRVEDRLDEVLARIKEKAREAGWRQARKTLRRIAPRFTGPHADPKDVKVLFDPVLYVAFWGLTEERPRRIELLDLPPRSRDQERVQRSIERSTRKGNIEWKTLRVDDDGRVREET